MAQTPLGAEAVFCHGPILQAVAAAGIFPDSKTFVDMSLRADPEVIDIFTWSIHLSGFCGSIIPHAPRN